MPLPHSAWQSQTLPDGRTLSVDKDIWPAMKESVRHIFCAAQWQHFTPAPPSGAMFELFGLDFMVDLQGRAVLIEVWNIARASPRMPENALDYPRRAENARDCVVLIKVWPAPPRRPPRHFSASSRTLLGTLPDTSRHPSALLGTLALANSAALR